MPIECLLPQLDLFEERKVQIEVERTEQIPLKPLAALENNRVIQFSYKGYGETYKNLSSIYLILRVKMEHVDNADVVVTAQPTKNAQTVFPVNNLLHSLFRQISLTLNGQQVAMNSANYPYRSYFEHLLNFETDIGHQVRFSKIDIVRYDCNDLFLESIDSAYGWMENRYTGKFR